MKNKMGILFLLAAAMLFSFAIAEAEELSSYHKLNIDPISKSKVGEKLVNEVLQFFHDAELAIENKNIDALMDLYSKNIRMKYMIKVQSRQPGTSCFPNSTHSRQYIT